MWSARYLVDNKMLDDVFCFINDITNLPTLWKGQETVGILARKQKLFNQFSCRMEIYAKFHFTFKIIYELRLTIKLIPTRQK